MFVLSAVMAAAGFAAAENQPRIINTPEGIVIEQDIEAEDFVRERPRRMEDVGGLADALSELNEQPADGGVVEFVPKNQIIIMEKTPETPAPDTAKKGGSEFENTRAIGMRINFGNAIGAGGYFKVPIAEKQRIDAGVGLGFGFGRDGYSLTYFEAVGMYEWRFDIDDGVLGWYAGSGVVFGWYGTSKKNVPQSPDTTGHIELKRVTHGDYGVGVGGVFGLEVDLGFIDADHSLYSLRDMSVGMELRPVFYWPIVKQYPVAVITVGFSFRWAL